MAQEFTTEEIKLFLERITPNKDALYIFQPMGLADILCSGGFSYAAQQKKNKNSTVIIVHEGIKNFGIAYENVSKISYIAPQILSSIKKYLDDNEIHETDNLIYGCLDPTKEENYTVAEGLNLIDYYRKKVFDLPLDTPCHTPIISPLSDEEISYWNNQYTLDKERTVILSAYSNFKNAEEVNFWNDMVKKLQEKNYIVYTYVENFSQKSFQNTIPIFANLSELSYIMNNVKCFITSRLGVSLFLAMNTDANIFFINNFPCWFWDISKMFPNSNSHTFYLSIELMASIINAINKDGVIVQLEMSIYHPKINSENIFHSHQSILEKILAEVEKF